MYRDKKFIAIIPARSGSKGLKDKNIKLLNGKHLIGYSIEAAIKSKVFDEIIVSTDSKEYAQISEIYGATIPFLRDGKLATDNASTVEVIRDVIEQMKSKGKIFDYFVLLQPTSPLRTYKDIVSSVDMLLNNNLNSIVSVCEAEHSLELYNYLPKDNGMYEFIDCSKSNIRRQDTKKAYRINGAIYISEIKEYLSTESFYGIKSKAYIMEKENSIDIDTEFDFKFAEFILNK